MPLFKKDFSIFGTKEKTIQIPPIPTFGAAAPAPTPPTPPKPRERAYHSTLVLLDKHNLPQEPPGYWDDKILEETPSFRIEGSRPVFDPDSRARQAQSKLAREWKARRAAHERRSLEEGWLEGPARNIARSLEELEGIRADVREACRWQNIYLEVKEHRKATTSWFTGEIDEERKCRLATEAALRSVRALEWTREFEPQLPEQQETSGGNNSVRALKLTQRASTGYYTTSSAASNRYSMSSTTTKSTPRSSLMSTRPPSTIPSPISSGLPSPTMSINSKRASWRGSASLNLASPLEKAAPMELPPPVVDVRENVSA